MAVPPEVESLSEHYGVSIAVDQSLRFSKNNGKYKVTIADTINGGEVTVIMTERQFAAMQYVMIMGDEASDELYKEAEEVFKDWPEAYKCFRPIP